LLQLILLELLGEVVDLIGADERGEAEDCSGVTLDGLQVVQALCIHQQDGHLGKGGMRAGQSRAGSQGKRRTGQKRAG
jgi:hypothetical protein